jgi:ribonuclease E
MRDDPQRAVRQGAEAAGEGAAAGALTNREGEAPVSGPGPSGAGAEGSDGAATTTSRTRRRRRGGRGRSRGSGANQGEGVGANSAGDDAAVTEPAVEAGGADAAARHSADADVRPDRQEQAGGGERTTTSTRSRSPSRSRSRSRSRSSGAAAEADGEPEAARGAGPKAEPDRAPAAQEGSEDAAGPEGARRRRRRGGRGRGRSRSGASAGPEAGEEAADTASGPQAETKDASEPAAAPVAETAGAPAGAEQPAPATRRSRSRRRGSRGGAKAGANGDTATAATATAEPPAEPAEAATVQRKRQPARAARGAATKSVEAAAAAPAEGEPAAAGTRSRRRRGSGKAAVATEAKPRASRAEAPPEGAHAPTTRGRRPRLPGRRRREALPQARRGQDKLMLITEHGERDQIAVVEDNVLVEHYITRVGAHSMVGNIYLGRVQNVLPGMEAAFIDIGRGRNAVLYAGEVSHSEDVEGRPPRIEQVLKPGQAVLVQVTKDPMGSKGPRLTQEVSLPGRFLVLVPNSSVFGISRRLPDDERRRLRAAIKRIRGDEHGVIVRTAAEGASVEDLEADLTRLGVEWEQIEKRTKKARAPSLLYEEPELTLRVVRDLFNSEEFREIVTDTPRVHENISAYLRDIAPDLLERVRLHDGRLPLFEHYHVIEQIHKALERKIWLPSGGYLIIERTEAMTVIDVNTGKHVGKTNLEETVVRTNFEAAAEIARQLRLRDIGGIIIIDFIDMLLQQNRDRIVETIREELARDKTRSQIFDISPLGILEVTRKRVSAGLLESFSETCPTCQGRGILLTHEIG